jgi:transketolase
MSLEVRFNDVIFENKAREAGEFQHIALELRKDIIKSLYLAKSGHSGGSLDTVDLLSVLFYGGFMRYDAKNPDWKERDRFVLSAGHLAPVYYAALAHAGYFPVEELATLRKYGSRLQGHPGRDTHLPGIETASGSLGQGVSIAVGMAMSHKFLDKTTQRVFTLSGDGEMQEGSTWEAAMAAGNYGLDNLCWIVDNNDCQIDGRVKDVMSIYPLPQKLEAFNFEIIEIDGHDFGQIIGAYKQFIKNHESGLGKPTAIIAKTFMGEGVSFMRDDYNWHGIPPNEEQAAKALAELDKLG